MSSYVDQKYFYQLKGRQLHIYKISGYGSDIPDTQGRLKDARANIIYPDETISDGIRIEYTSIIEPFIVESLENSNASVSGTGISFTESEALTINVTEGQVGSDYFADSPFTVTGGTGTGLTGTIASVGGQGALSTVTLVDGGKNYTVNDVLNVNVSGHQGAVGKITVLTVDIYGIKAASGLSVFTKDDSITIQGSTSNDGDFIVSGTATDTVVPLTPSPIQEAVGANITIQQKPIEVTGSSIGEISHLNLNRRLSLAIIDFIKAMISEKMGQLEMKEYYIRSFYKNLGDNDSNKRKIRFSFVHSPFGVR